ncbi:MAG: hypothetical protein ACLGGX_03010 [Bdellovibrionia bacterium]
MMNAKNITNKKILSLFSLAAFTMMGTACNKSADGFSLLADETIFKQETVLVPKKIDVLWVVDNSGSMETSQNNLASNFQSFIYRFNQKNYDFHMGVVTTDAWEKRFYSSSTKARLRDGVGATRSGVYVMDKNTPNLSDVFTTNIKQGINGNGDERAFESFKEGLNETFNAPFRRPEAFLAVIIVSDEEDFSRRVLPFDESYSSPDLIPVSNYVSFLDQFTNRQVGEPANYSVSTISVLDSACRTQLSTDGFQRKIGTRLMQLADLTGGVKGSLCSNFGETLDIISDSILQLSSAFKLSREPVVESIVVRVDGTVIPQDPVNGWTYDPATMYITFHGSSIPGANSDVRVAFDPVRAVE